MWILYNRYTGMSIEDVHFFTMFLCSVRIRVRIDSSVVSQVFDYLMINYAIKQKGM